MAPVTLVRGWLAPFRSMAACSAVILITLTAVLGPASAARADDARNRLWYLTDLGVAAAQAIADGRGVTVAVLDSGVAADHPDLAGAVLPQVNVTTGSTDGRPDPDGHGTAMAATIAGRGHGTGNRDGVLGIAPGAKVLPISLVRGDVRLGYTGDDVARGITLAVEHGATVINASITTSGTTLLQQAIKEALDADVVIVAASGNERNDVAVMSAPARYRGVVAVGASDRQGNRASFSVPASGLTEMSLCAPGVDGVAAIPGGTYDTGKNGTSMSSAIVAGAAALLRSKNPQMPAYEVVHRLEATAIDNGTPGRDKDCGFGRLNLGAALTANVPPAPSPSPWTARSPSPSTPPTGSGPAAASPPHPRNGPPIGLLIGVLAAAAGVGVGVGVWWWRRAAGRNR